MRKTKSDGKYKEDRRIMHTIGDNITYPEFRELEEICYRVAPRNMHSCCKKANGNYFIEWNLSDKEFDHVCTIYYTQHPEMRGDKNE